MQENELGSCKHWAQPRSAEERCANEVLTEMAFAMAARTKGSQRRCYTSNQVLIPFHLAPPCHSASIQLWKSKQLVFKYIGNSRKLTRLLTAQVMGPKNGGGYHYSRYNCLRTTGRSNLPLVHRNLTFSVFIGITGSFLVVTVGNWF